MDLKDRVRKLTFFDKTSLAMKTTEQALVLQWVQEIGDPDCILHLFLSQEPPFIRPMDVMGRLFGLSPEAKNTLRILRI